MGRPPTTVIAHCIVLALLACPSIAASAPGAGTFSTPDSSLTVPIVTAAGDQWTPATVSDGAGGAIVMWMDGDVPSTSLYAQHVLGSGGIDPGWPANGVLITGTSLNAFVAVMTTDGAGGAIVAWEESGDDLRAQRVLSNGTTAWGASGTILATALAIPYKLPRIAADHAGGAYIAWQDDRNDPDNAGTGSATTDIFATHVTATGLDVAWPVNGLAVCTAASVQSTVHLCTDGGTGALLAWKDARTPGNSFDIYAHHVIVTGTADPAWPANGAVVCARTGSQRLNAMPSGSVLAESSTSDYQADFIEPDGSGGCLVTWMDGPANNQDIYVQHLRNDGTADPGWTPGGVAVCTASGSQFLPRLVPDGNGGALVTWDDGRNGVIDSYYGDLFAQRVLPNGSISGPANGLGFTSGSHASSPQAVSDGTGGMLVFWEDGRDLATLGIDVYADHIVTSPELAHDFDWTMGGYPLCRRVGDQPQVMAVATGNGGAIAAWTDTRDADQSGKNAYAGFVVGNVATPALLIQFRADAGAAGIELRWEFADPARFTDVRLERAATEAGPWTSVSDADVRVVDGATFAWDRNVVGERTYYYRLVATSPNEQRIFGPLVATAHAAIGKLVVTSIAPNPTPHGASIGYALPRESKVELSVLDVAGRVVAVLANGVQAGGSHATTWNGEAAGHAVEPGLYFVRLKSVDATVVRRLVIAR